MNDGLSSKNKRLELTIVSSVGNVVLAGKMHVDRQDKSLLTFISQQMLRTFVSMARLLRCQSEKQGRQMHT